jgi:hypothetical protein
MATITASTTLDEASGTRTAAEAWTMNAGAVLTIRTDTRWHAKSPAGMTGSLGNTTISAIEGGGVLIDSTKVRWMPYNTGSGNVPAVNTSISQGGVTGILLGVWASYTSAPSAVGSAMPTTGFIKFREVTGGTFTTGALTGIGASATAPDRQGWIEIVEDQSANNTVPRLGFFRTRGGWFILDQVTSGNPNDIIQIPTNGGGAGTHVPAIWIESVPIAITSLSWAAGTVTVVAPDHGFALPYEDEGGVERYYSYRVSVSGSNPAGYNAEDEKIKVLDKDRFTYNLAVNPGVYVSGASYQQWELYPALLSTWFLAANLDTDIRCKFVQTLGSGQVRIGFDGTANAGFVPPAGCRIRIPSNIGRQTSSANRTLNLVPHTTTATRPRFTTTAAGDIDFEHFINDWQHLFASAYRVRIVHCASFDLHNSVNEASPTELHNYGIGATITGQTLTLTNNSLGGTISNCRFVRPDAASNGHSANMTGCANYKIDTLRTGVVAYARNSGNVSINQCRNISIGDMITYQTALVFSTCSNIHVKGMNYIDRLKGITNATTGKHAVQCLVSCDNITVDGVIFSYAGNLGPYLGVFQSSNSSNLTFRNVGKPDAPENVNVSAAPAVIYLDGGNNDGVRVQKCYLLATRTALVTTVNTSKNLLLESLVGTNGATAILSINSQLKGGRSASNSVTGGASVYGSHWYDQFVSDTEGRVWLAMNEPTAFSASQFSSTLGAGAGFTSGGQISMPNLNDQIIFEMPYYALGHTAFANLAPTLTGTNTGNFSYEYDIDVNDGLGFTGTYKVLNGANLSAETINHLLGFKLRFRITVTVAALNNALTYVRVTTVTTLVAQQAVDYPLDYAIVKLSGYVLGTRIQIYDLTNNKELYNGIPSETTLTYAAPYLTDITVRIRAMYVSGVTAKKFVEFSDTLTVSGLTRTIDQEDEPVYIANGVDGSAITSVEIDDDVLLVKVDTGVIEWGDIFAYETYWLGTLIGIRDEGRFIEAVDPANYKLFNFKIKNVSSPSEPLVLTGGWAVDGITGKSIDTIDTSGGTIFSAPEHVVAFETSGGGGGGATASEIWNFASRRLTSAGISDISAGVLTAASTTPIAANTKRVNDIPISGAGTELDPWGP